MTERLRLGIDIGATKVALALGDAAGEVLAQSRYPFDRSGDQARDLETLAAAVEALLLEQGLAPAVLEAVGVAAPGPLDLESGRVIAAPNLPGWGEISVRGWLASRFGVPVALENDANAAALAEWRHGAGRGVERMVYLTMSTGVGGGLVLDGKLYRGLYSSAGEVGHMPIEWDGLLCACGRRGCLEAYIGGAALGARLRRETPEGSAVLALAGGRDAIRPEHWLQAARKGDGYAQRELDRYNDYLARGIVQLVFILAPDRVVLGTIPMAAGEALCFAPVRSLVRERIWPFFGERFEIVPAALGEALPARAALCVADLALQP